MDTPRSTSGQNPSTDPADLSGVKISGQANVTARDIIGRDKIIHGDEYIGYSAAQVTVLLDKIRTEYQSKPFDGRSPYIGLASFQERDADKFFGRETLTAELVTRVATSAASNARAVFVAGPSGSGKSSLVRAGLVPALRKGVQLNAPTVAGSEHWLYETLKPGRAPLDELARVVSSFANSPDAGDDLRAHALNDAERLHRWADIALKDDTNRRAVIVIDQFEEIFTQLASERENERVAFLQSLTHAATVENGRVLVIFTLRSDFVSNCASYPNLNALVNQQFIQVGAMTPDELVSAIARPALQVGLQMDPALISQIVNDVRGEPGALPLMQFALQDLFQAEKHKGELTLDGYLARGGLHEALERHADAEFAKLDDAEKQLARTVFSGLIEIGRGREDTKRTALFDELVPTGADAASVRTLITKLADARLITTDEQDGKETVTLAHERLIDAWDWLRKLVDENRDAIALQNEIAQDAQEWETSGRDEGYLYRGARLATAQEKLQQNQLVLSGLAQEFVETAIAARERERSERESVRQRELEQAQALAAEQKQRAEEQLTANKRLRQRNLFLAGAFVLAVVAVIAALFFLTQSDAQRDVANRANAAAQTEAAKRGAAERTAVSDREVAVQANSTSQAANSTAQAEANMRAKESDSRATAEANALLERDRAEEQAKINKARSLVAQSASLADKQFDFALLLSLEALKVATNQETRGALLNLLMSQNRIKGYLHGYKDQVLAVAYSPDGKTIATGSDDRSLIIWDANTHQIIYRTDSPGISSLAYSPDGKRLLLGKGFSMALWDVTTKESLGSFYLGGYGLPSKALFSPDGKLIAGALNEGDIRIYESSIEAEMVRDPVVHLKTRGINQIAFSPDGRYLAAANTYRDKTISIWDTRTWQPVREPLKVPEEMVSLTFSPDSSIIASGGVSGKIILWDVATGQILDKELSGHHDKVRNLVFSPDGNILASASEDGNLILWDTTMQMPIAALLQGHKGIVHSIAFSPDGATLVSGSSDNSVILWTIKPKGRLEHSISGPTNLSSVAFSLDSNILAASSNRNPTLLWDLIADKPLGELKSFPRNGSSSIGFGLDHKTIASLGCADSGVEYECKWVIDFWDLDTLALNGESLTTDYDVQRDVSSIKFRNDNKTLLTAGCIYRDYSQASHFRNDCRTIEINIWDASRHRSVRSPLAVHMDSINSIAFSPDGRTTAIGGCVLRKDSSFCEFGLIRLYDLIAQQPIGNPLAGHLDTVSALAFNPFGTLLASGSKDGTTILWDVQEQEPIRQPLRGHRDSIIGLGFLSAGQVLASSSRDNTTILWDVATGVPLGLPVVVSPNKNVGHTMTVSEDGKRIAAGGYRGEIVVWDVDLESWKHQSCFVAGRNLTHSEWEQYVKSGSQTFEDYRKNPTCTNLPVEQ